MKIKNNKKIHNKINKLINQQQDSARDQESTLKDLKKIDKSPEPETPRKKKPVKEGDGMAKQTTDLSDVSQNQRRVKKRNN